MGLPVEAVTRIGAYIAKQHFSGNKRYPLVRA